MQRHILLLRINPEENIAIESKLEKNSANKTSFYLYTIEELERKLEYRL